MADKRLPLFILQSNRDNTSEKDAQLVNGYIEVTQDKQVWVYKRPGIKPLYASLPLGVGQAIGLFSSGGVLYIGTTGGFYTFNPVTLAVGTLIPFTSPFSTPPFKRTFFTLMKSSLPYVLCQGCLVGNSSNQTQAQPYIAVAMAQVDTTAGKILPPLNNYNTGTFTASSFAGSTSLTLNAPYYPVGSGFRPNIWASLIAGLKVVGNGIPAGVTITFIHPSLEYIILSAAATSTETLATYTYGVTGDLTLASATITNVATPAGLVGGVFVYGAGIPTGAIVQSTTANTITLNQAVTSTTPGVMLAFSNNGLPVSPATFQAVPGLAYLDGSTYLLDWNGGLWASDFFNPLSYPAVNQIVSQGEADYAVALFRQIQYLIVFRDYSVEFFYDAGNAVGSPLAPVPGSRLPVGCVDAFSIVGIDGVLYFLSQSRGGNISFGKVAQLGYASISNPAVDRLLQGLDYSNITAYAVKSNGHAFYCFTSFVSNVTLVYDTGVGEWYVWEDMNGAALDILDTTFHIFAGNTYTVGVTTSGTLVTIDPTSYTDGSNPIPLTLVTPNFDGGTTKRKVLAALDIVADQAAGSMLTVSYSDDDYQTWSAPRVLALTQRLNRLTKQGTFLHRAHRFTHSSPTPFRLTAVEYELTLGVI